MNHFHRILENNRRWVEARRAEDPDFFKKMAEGQQQPHFLFIGCSDSRVPANHITGTGPGETFVQRNIANQVFINDLNLLSVLQYAVEVLQVEHVIVCGHHGCGGVQAAMGQSRFGLVDNWLGQIREIYENNRAFLDEIPQPMRTDRLVDLSVLRQVENLSHIPLVRDAWKRGKRPILHGLTYELDEGLLHPLVTEICGVDDVPRIGERARELLGPEARW